MTEEWKDIKGFEGKYQASSLGRIRSLNYRGNTGKVHILKPQNCSNGYLRVDLYDKNYKCIHRTVHSLVADAFLPNPLNLPCVNHKDENKHNCTLSNLERCTHKYNSNYGTSILRTKEKLRQKKGLNVKALEKTRKKVNQYTINGIYLKTYKSIADAARELNLINGCNISYCCKGKRKTAYGYVWRYADEEI